MKLTFPSMILLASLTLAWTGPLTAAEDAAGNGDSGAAGEAEAGDRSAGNARTEGEKASDDGQGTEVFVPSEEISEDFAVSFPVDI